MLGSSGSSASVHGHQLDTPPPAPLLCPPPHRPPLPLLLRLRRAHGFGSAAEAPTGADTASDAEVAYPGCLWHKRFKPPPQVSDVGLSPLAARQDPRRHSRYSTPGGLIGASEGTPQPPLQPPAADASHAASARLRFRRLAGGSSGCARWQGCVPWLRRQGDEHIVTVLSDTAADAQAADAAAAGARSRSAAAASVTASIDWPDSTSNARDSAPMRAPDAAKLPPRVRAAAAAAAAADPPAAAAAAAPAAAAAAPAAAADAVPGGAAGAASGSPAAAAPPPPLSAPRPCCDVPPLLTAPRPRRDAPLLGFLRLFWHARSAAAVALVGPDTARVDLTGAGLVGTDIARVDLTRARLVGTDVARVDLTRAGPVGVGLIGARLNRVGLVGAGPTGFDVVRTGPVWVDLGRVAPDKIRVAPDKVRVAPDKVGVAPDKVGVAHDKIGVAPDKVRVAPDKVAVMEVHLVGAALGVRPGAGRAQRHQPRTQPCAVRRNRGSRLAGGLCADGA
eukprot:57156-Chlamydomonas_euryale.AAC.1